MGIDIKPKFISFDMNGTLDECAPRQAPVEETFTVSPMLCDKTARDRSAGVPA